MKKKIRAHRKCTCGSKRKYRNCCGKNKTINFNNLPKETQKSFRELQLEQKIGSNYHNSHFGYTPEIVTTIFKEKRLVALGGRILQSDNPERDWQDPAELLNSHLKKTLGNEWFDKELKKSKDKRHSIITWAMDSSYNVLNSNKPLDSKNLNGSALAYLHLAYDLFVMHNKHDITKNFISRLKNTQSFNGARYELFVFATLIRAGFELELFDETCGRGRVTECRAKHLKTGVTFQVEAKTRNVEGVLGSIEGNPKKIKINGALNKAIEKGVKEPYLIFLDLNFPELAIYEGSNKLKKTRGKLYKFIKENPNDLFNAIICTNIPFHYARDDKSTADTAFGIVRIDNPKFTLKNEEIILNTINQSLEQYQYLPREFNESEKFAAEVTKTMTNSGTVANKNFEDT